MNRRDHKILITTGVERLNTHPGGCTLENGPGTLLIRSQLGDLEAFEKGQESVVTTGIRTQGGQARDASALPIGLFRLMSSI
jgi:hypothetical protein